MSKTAFADNLKPHMESMHAAVILYDSDACTKDMAQFLWATEIDKLNQSATFLLSTQLQSPNVKDNAWAHFKIAGRLIHAADQSLTTESFVKCYGVKKPLSFHGGHQSLFLNHTVGCTYMTLDRPYPLHM